MNGQTEHTAAETMSADHETDHAPGETNGQVQDTTPANGDTAPLLKPVHVPAENWTCIPCGAVNSPFLEGVGDDAKMTVPSTCHNCGKARSEKLEELGATHKTVEALAGGLQEHAQNAAGAEQVERGDAAGDARPSTKPADRELPFPKGRFDSDRAFVEIERQNAIVQTARSEWEDLKEQAAEARKTYDKATETLSQLITREGEKKRGVAQQPYLTELTDSGTASCPVSSAMGSPCPACASQRAKGEEADINDPLHPAHPQHEAIAKSLLVKDAQDLSTRLMGKHFYMEAAALMLLPIDQLQTLQRYSVQKGPIPPDLLVRAHLAAKAGTTRQECKRCGLLLVDLAKGDRAEYPENSAIGLDCDRPDQVAQTTGPADEKSAARAPKSHAKKDLKKKTDPEAEGTRQKAEGRRQKAEGRRSEEIDRREAREEI